MMKELEFWNEIEEIGTLNVEMELLVGLEPVLFVCVLEDNPNIKYLVMTYNSAKTTYVMRKIDDEELLLMLDKKVSMEETFRNGNEILKTYMLGDDIYIERYNPLEFDGNMLPRKGATYNIHSQYILDYKEELRTPKYGMKFNYNEYKVERMDYFASSVNEVGNAIVCNIVYQPIMAEELSCGTWREQKIA